MASTGIIQRRYNKFELIASPPIVGEIVFALDTEEFGTLINGEIVWRKFDDVIKSVNGKTGHIIISKSDFDLGNVDNTSDLDKPVSTLTRNLIDLHTSDKNNPHNVTKDEINLNNVDNTSDLDKPLSTAIISALSEKLNKNDTAEDSNRLGGFLADVYLRDGDAYTKSESDSLLNYKANLSSVYTKVDTDSKLNLKADTDTVYTKEVADSTFEVKSEKGQPGGYADLGVDGKVPSIRLPASVTGKTVITVDSLTDLPASNGQLNTVYITLDTNTMYIYDENGNRRQTSTSLGETSVSAYRGDRGKIAYDHTSNTNNPHNVTATEVGAYTKDDTYTKDETDNQIDTTLTVHTSNTNNPHNVTASEINVYTKDESDSNLSTHTSNTNNPHNVTAAEVGAYTKDESNINVNSILSVHTSNTNNPHNVTATEVGAYTKDESNDNLSAHTSNTNNPHNVTATEVGAYTKDEADNQIDTTLAVHTSNTNNPHGVTAAQINVYTKDESNANLSAIDAESLGVYNKSDANTLLLNNASNETYESSVPMIDKLGNLEIGTMFSGTVSETLDRILVPEGATNFQNFYIDDIAYMKLINDTIPAGTYTAHWYIYNSEDVNDSSIKITNTDGTVLVDNITNVLGHNSVDITLPNDITSTTENLLSFTISAIRSDNSVIYHQHPVLFVNTLAVDDTASTSKNTSVIIDVLANDTDSGTNSPIGYISKPINGIAYIDNDGKINYTPNTDFVGTDILDYTNTQNSKGTISITVS